MSTQIIQQLVDKVEGWLTNKEGVALYHLAQKTTGAGVIVEIGSWKGKSTIWLAKGSQAGKHTKIYAIDPHVGSFEHTKKHGEVKTFEAFKHNIEMAGTKDLIVSIVKTSRQAATTFDFPVEVIFIDGAHEYELVKLDFELWFPKVINGGKMAFHDTINWDGPRRVVEEFIFKSRHFKNIRRVDSIVIAEKVENNTKFDRVHNRYVLFLKDTLTISLKLLRPSWRLLKKYLK